ncbi:hypothetical protein PsYK624_096300 [Phanerochaete sordida]|uniref:F-box domain-containing protein n=1 Tax=Phanerochaete sordida TaxID=48140 RepID=A0A9P3GEJ7_9APHY|nr:hypothetical protein PsYK624_096300 [Phanerochaete sordida]
MAALGSIKTLAHDIVQRIDSLALAVNSYKSLSESLATDSIQGVDDALSLALSHVRVLRNFRSPVNSLPPEILTTIFRCLMEPETQPQQHRTLTGVAPSAGTATRIPISITHVCRYWRDSALGCPLLWSPIVFEPKDMATKYSLPYLCLQRALGAPLDVQIKCSKSMDPQIWSVLAARSSRLRRVQVIDLLGPEQLRELRQAVPILHTLHIEVSHDLFDRRWEGEDLLDELPELFAGSTPALRHLKLNLFTSFSTNRFANLEVLHLSHQIYRERGDLASLFALLEASLQLEEVSLTDCHLAFAHEGPVPTGDRFLPLYRLRRLTLVDCHASLVSSVLARVETAHGGIALLIKDWTPSRPLNALFPPPATSRLHALAGVTALALDYDRAEVRAGGGGSAVRLALEPDLDTADALAPALAALFPLHALRSVALAGIELHGAPFWRGFLGALPALAHLALWLPPTQPQKWVEALRPDAGTAYPAPLLDTLTVFPPYPAVLDAAAAVLQARAEDGHRLRVLNVVMEERTRDAEIRRAFEGLDIAALEQFVDRVVQDVVSRYGHEFPVPEEHRAFIAQ